LLPAARVGWLQVTVPCTIALPLIMLAVPSVAGGVVTSRRRIRA
jgi:hypothetical protein